MLYKGMMNIQPPPIRDFLIANFRLRIVGNDWIRPAGHFAYALRIFKVEYAPELVPIVELRCDAEQMPDPSEFRLVDRFPFQEVDAECTLYINERQELVTMELKSGEVFWLAKEKDSPYTRCNLMDHSTLEEVGSLLRFGLWMIFGMAILPHRAIAIHSSAIVSHGLAVLFLGESGTGKSTHTRLWREHISGAELLNDDSPILRVEPQGVMAYGSPWSGKTPCYRQERFPVSGFVRLQQAPHNRIEPLKTLRALGALLPSCPPSFCHDGRLNDLLCNTLSELVAQSRVYHLECLPDPAAAQLSYQTLIG